MNSDWFGLEHHVHGQQKDGEVIWLFCHRKLVTYYYNQRRNEMIKRWFCAAILYNTMWNWTVFHFFTESEWNLLWCGLWTRCVQWNLEESAGCYPNEYIHYVQQSSILLSVIPIAHSFIQNSKQDRQNKVCAGECRKFFNKILWHWLSYDTNFILGIFHGVREIYIYIYIYIHTHTVFSKSALCISYLKIKDDDWSQTKNICSYRLITQHHS